MKNNLTFTSSLPVELLNQLSENANKLNISKNKLIEYSLRHYFDELKKQEYIRSFQRAAEDKDLLTMTEEGIEDYFAMIEKL